MVPCRHNAVTCAFHHFCKKKYNGSHNFLDRTLERRQTVPSKCFCICGLLFDISWCVTQKPVKEHPSLRTCNAPWRQWTSEPCCQNDVEQTFCKLVSTLEPLCCSRAVVARVQDWRTAAVRSSCKCVATGTRLAFVLSRNCQQKMQAKSVFTKSPKHLHRWEMH